MLAIHPSSGCVWMQSSRYATRNKQSLDAAGGSFVGSALPVRVAQVYLDRHEHLRQSGTNHQDPEAQKKPGQVVTLQALHQYVDICRHW